MDPIRSRIPVSRGVEAPRRCFGIARGPSPAEKPGYGIVWVPYVGFYPLAENLGKPSLWVIISAGWYETAAPACWQGRLRAAMPVHRKRSLTLSSGPEPPPAVAYPAPPRRRGRLTMRRIDRSSSSGGNTGYAISVVQYERNMLSPPPQPIHAAGAIGD